MKHLRLSLIVFLLLSIVTPPCGATTDCDYAKVVFFWGSMGPERNRLQRYMKAIEHCPGFIRPHELIGNYYRKQGNNERAIDYFKKAAELGSVNYKLYYLLGLLYYQQKISCFLRHYFQAYSLVASHCLSVATTRYSPFF